MLVPGDARNDLLATSEVVEQPQDLPGLRAGWEALARSHGWSPLQDYAWSATAATTVDAGQPLAVVVVGDRARPTAIAPLVRRRGRLELLGAASAGEPADLLYTDTAALDALARALAGLRLPLLLNRLPAGSPVPGALGAAFRPPSVTVTRPAAAHAAIELDEGWTAPEGRLSARRASDLRRARRRAEAAGGLEAELLAPEVGELDELLQEAFSIEARGWKGRERTALESDPARCGFFRAYARAAAERGELRLAFLRVGGRRVAMQLGIEWRGRLWLLKIGHDEAAGRCSPGMLLLLESVRDAAARGLGAVQLLGGVEAWTSVWTDRVQECVTAAAYPAGVASLGPAVSDAAAVVRRAAARRRG